eukprot:TRINITY_DN55026_c0_g1_i1.p1 TRINITY_DN55026_c0_g1~~TRINITY_DN55026_c0_g1_i1.p1  ORF type:complete len:1358 (+),score=354.78 TRINITY_DN55026_c0_g1_i1:105-4178(+)
MLAGIPAPAPHSWRRPPSAQRRRRRPCGSRLSISPRRASIRLPGAAPKNLPPLRSVEPPKPVADLRSPAAALLTPHTDLAAARTRSAVSGSPATEPVGSWTGPSPPHPAAQQRAAPLGSATMDLGDADGAPLWGFEILGAQTAAAAATRAVQQRAQPGAGPCDPHRPDPTSAALSAKLRQLEEQQRDEDGRRRSRHHRSPSGPRTSLCGPMGRFGSWSGSRQSTPAPQPLVGLRRNSSAFDDDISDGYVASSMAGSHSDLRATLSDLMYELRREDDQQRRERRKSVQSRGVVPKMLRRRKPRGQKATLSAAAALDARGGDQSWMRQLASGQPRASFAAAAEAMTQVVRIERELILDEDTSEEGDPCDPEAHIAEVLTGLVPRDLHNYLIYCCSNKVNIILRPISQSAYGIYSGEFHLVDKYNEAGTGYPDWDKIKPLMDLSHVAFITRQKVHASAKGIGVSLKSSPYGPIAGLIPLDPQLSKVAGVHAEYVKKLEKKVLEAEQDEQRNDLRRRSSPVGHTPRSPRGSPRSPRLRRRLSASGSFCCDSPRTTVDAQPQSSRLSLGRGSVDSGTSFGGGGGTTSGGQARHLRERMLKLKVMEDTNMLMLQKLEQDYTETMGTSADACNELLRKYRLESVATLDKHSVSLRYIDDFNQSQFLGTTPAQDVLGNDILHFTQPHAEGLHPALVVRDPDNDDPIFATKTAAGNWKLWDRACQIFIHRPDWQPQPQWTERITHVITHRKFVVNEVTKRIEEVESDLIVPDYDGLAWAPDNRHPKSVVDLAASDGENVERLVNHFLSQMYERLETSDVPTMGGVSRPDVQHVQEMRILTDWRQNHGYEYQNLSKTQDMLPGNYVSIESDQTVRILENLGDIMAHYASAWRRGVPLMINPNWPVYLDASGTPRTLDRDTTSPLYDDGAKLSNIAERARKEGVTMERLRTRAAEIQRARGGGSHEDIIVPFPKKGVSDLVRALVRVHDEKRVMRSFWALRKVLMYPPLLLCCPSELEELVADREEAEQEAACRDLIDRLMPRVVAEVQIVRDQRVDELRKLLRRQLGRFRRKHGDVQFMDDCIRLIDEEDWSDGDDAINPCLMTPPESPHPGLLDMSMTSAAQAARIPHMDRRLSVRPGSARRSVCGVRQQRQWGVLGQREDDALVMQRMLQHSNAIAAGLRNWINRAVNSLSREARSQRLSIAPSGSGEETLDSPLGPAAALSSEGSSLPGPSAQGAPHSAHRRSSVASPRKGSPRTHRRERHAREAVRITKRAMDIQLAIPDGAFPLPQAAIPAITGVSQSPHPVKTFATVGFCDDGDSSSAGQPSPRVSPRAARARQSRPALFPSDESMHIEQLVAAQRRQRSA